LVLFAVWLGIFAVAFLSAMAALIRAERGGVLPTRFIQLTLVLWFAVFFFAGAANGIIVGPDDTYGFARDYALVAGGVGIPFLALALASWPDDQQLFTAPISPHRAPVVEGVLAGLSLAVAL